MSPKRYLFTPGPTPVPPEVLAALGEPVLHHRAPDFRVVFERVLARLRDVHRTTSDVLLFTCSGTGAFESAIVNLCSPGDRVLAVSSGYFGERWAAMARTFGCEVEELRYAWGETPSADDLARKLAELEPVSLVFLVQSETSTAVIADVQALAAAASSAPSAIPRRRRRGPIRPSPAARRRGSRRRRRQRALLPASPPPRAPECPRPHPSTSRTGRGRRARPARPRRACAPARQP